MKLTHDGARYVFECSYDQRVLAKAASFRWDPESRQWWTDEQANAWLLAEHADASALAMLRPKAEPEQRKLVVAPVPAERIPSPLGVELYTYQREGVAFALRRERALIADDPGLGKTNQALATVACLPASQRKTVFIVCPKSVVGWWREQAYDWLPDATIQIVPWSRVTKLRAPGEGLPKGIEDPDWDVLILDEVHYAKNDKAQRTRAIFGHGKKVKPIKARRVIALSGTPMLNRPVELWPVLHYLAPDKFPVRWDFLQRYCAPYQDKWGWHFDGASNLSELREKIASVMIRRRKADVLPQLPPKTRQVITLPADSREERHAITAEAMLFDGLPAEYRRAILDLAEDIPRDRLASLLAARRVLAVAKAPRVVEHVLDMLAEGDGKIIVYAHHHDVVDAIAMGLVKAGELPLLHDGRMSMDDRNSTIKAFQQDPGFRVLVASIEATGVGLNLQCASTAIFAEFSWVPGTMLQAEDRIHRIGQSEPCLIQHLVLEGSLDAVICRTLIKKMDTIAQVMG